MKNIFPVLLLLIAPSLCAQDAKLTDTGTVELAGTISFSNYGAPAADFSYLVFKFAPQVSDFFFENVSLGVSPGLCVAGMTGGYSVILPSTHQLPGLHGSPSNDQQSGEFMKRR